VHTDRADDETRRHVAAYKIGSMVSIMTSKGRIYGHIDSMDEGGWVYPVWHDRPHEVRLPGYCRSTQLKLEEGKADVDADY
jgi:hypothetical protein